MIRPPELRKPFSNRCGRKSQTGGGCIHDNVTLSLRQEAQLRVSKHGPAAGQPYVGERGVGEEREAFEQVLVVVVLDHRRSVGLQHKLRGVTEPRGWDINQRSRHVVFRHG